MRAVLVDAGTRGPVGVGGEEPQRFGEPGPASGEISELLTGEECGPGEVRAVMFRAGIGMGDDGRTVHDDKGVGGGLVLEKPGPGIDELNGLAPGERQPPAEGDAAAHDVPVGSFVDDLRRKLQVKKVMPGAPGQKAEGEGDEQDQRGVPVPQEPVWSKDEVNYRYAADPKSACAACRFFVEPAACRLVMGMILKTDTCDRFEPEQEAGAVRATMSLEAYNPDQPRDRGRFASAGGAKKPAGPKPWEKDRDPQQGPGRSGQQGRGIGRDEGKAIFSKAGKDAGRKEAAMSESDSVRATMFREAAPWFGRHKNGENIGLSRLIQIQKGMEAVGYESPLGEVTPPGWEGTVKGMKKHKDITNPWALAWYMKGQGYSPHKEEQEGDGSNQYGKKGGAAPKPGEGWEDRTPGGTRIQGQGPASHALRQQDVAASKAQFQKPGEPGRGVRRLRRNPDGSMPHYEAQGAPKLAGEVDEYEEKREAEALRRLQRRMKESIRRDALRGPKRGPRRK